MNTSIVRTFQQDQFAIDRSHDAFKSKSKWTWGVDSEGNLYGRGQYSGFGTSDTWIPCERIKSCPTLKEMSEITNGLSGGSERTPTWFWTDRDSVKIDKLFCIAMLNSNDWFVDLVQFPEESENGKHTVFYKHEKSKLTIIATLGKEEGTLDMCYGGMWESDKIKRNR